MKSCIIIANGDQPSKQSIIFLNRYGIKTIIAADGGANSCFKFGIVPDFIIGDFDSIEPQILSYFEHKTKLVKYIRQNDTDVEKALKFAVKRKFKTVYLLGGTGDRLDHTICNLGIVIKFFPKVRIIMIHGKTILFPYGEDAILKTTPAETISLYAFNSNTRITSTGLKYRLHNSSLKFGEKESTSNVAIGDKVKLSISGGIVFVIREFNKVKKDDLIFHS